MATADDIIHIVSTQPTINGRYAEIRPLNGTGGGGYFSVVFRAKHIESGDPVALKFFIDNHGPYRLACFEREGQLLNTKLKGEDLFVQLMREPEELCVEFDVLGKKIQLRYPFLAFEWMDSGDLETNLVVPSGHAELLSALNKFEQACRCVGRLHHLGLFHRDLKPGNFFIHKREIVKLGDFGTTKLMLPEPMSLLPTYGGPAGDRRYTAPEMLAGLTISKELLSTADLFSLGAILYEMLTGQQLFIPMFGSLAEVAQFSAHMHGVPESNRTVTYHSFLDGARASRIPNLRAINAELPKCAFPLLNQIMDMLSHFDYRQRATTMTSIRNRIRICSLVVRNELQAITKLAHRKALLQRM